MSYYEVPSPRWKQILEGIAAGKTSATIAKDLGLARNTIKKHRTAIYKELGVHNGAAAVVRAARKGWIKIDGTP